MKLEEIFVRWFDDAVHLPLGVRKWMVNNAWWAVSVVVLMFLFALVFIMPRFYAALAQNSLPANAVSYVSYYPQTDKLAWLALLISIVSYVISAVVLTLAVPLLKKKDKLGWRMLFYLDLFNIILGTLNVLITFIGGIGTIRLFIVAVLSVYILLEMRELYTDGPTPVWYYHSKN